MRKHKITVVDGTARLEKGGAAPAVVVTQKDGGERRLEAKSVILATGARARVFPDVGLAPDGERIWTYREAMVPAACPKSLLVVGSGAIGIEFASFYRALGAEVTVIEALPRILPVEDEEVSAAAQKAFEKRGIAFRVSAKVTKLAKTKSGVALTLEAGGKAETLEAERAIVAVGIDANVEDIGLEALGLKLDRGHVVTDPHGATNVPGLYAIGDVAGPPWLAHKAMHEGVHCVEGIAGVADSGLTAPIPVCTYSTPQIASIGLTEAQAKEGGREVKVGRFPFRVNGKANAAGETEGFVKTVFDAKTGALIGAHMIGAEVTELIQGYVVAMNLETTEEELMHTVFPHPTLSEMMGEAVLDAYGRALNI
jgi:dihydrolipoamide dehydrogenase